MKLTESQKIYKNLTESLDYYDNIVDDVVCGNDVYVRLDEKDYSAEEGSDIYKIDISASSERPEDYDEGYVTGWNRGEDPEYDKEQDAKFERATSAFENGHVFEFNCVIIKEGKIKYTGFELLKCYGDEELKENLEYYKAKRVNVKTISSFEDEEEE